MEENSKKYGNSTTRKLKDGAVTMEKLAEDVLEYIEEKTKVSNSEQVNLAIASSVSSISVSGIKVNVFINHGTTPVPYTTDSEGKVSFAVNRGEYYEINVPQYGNAQPISPVGFTAVLDSRDISLEYQPYDEESSEKVIVTVTKYTEGVASVWEGLEVACTVDKKTTAYATDSKGQATIYVPYNKEYTVKVENQDGYNVSFNKNSRTYTAKVPQRMIDYKMYQFRAGIFVVDAEGTDYYIDEWTEAGKNADEAMAIKIADAALMTNKATFLIRTSDIKNISSITTKQWCTQNLQFTSIALNGNSSSDANYYNGETSSFLVRQEAQERSLSVPAFDYAYEQTFTIAGQTLNGFIMSVGQEYIHVANVSLIKQVLETLYGDEIATAYYNFVMKRVRWTSTQNFATYAWFCSSSTGDSNKIYSNYVLPVFACSLENLTSLSLDNSAEISNEQAS